MPAVEVLTEYVRACRRLGHDTPDPVLLHTAYTAEQSLDLGALAADCRTLSAAAAAAEEALTEQDGARNVVLAQWHGVGGDVAADFLRRHADASSVAVDNLRCAATALRDLADRLRHLVEEKVGTTTDIEARGVREMWLSASRTVTTGAGDLSAASELVDQQVAPFVATDVAGDWVTSMRSTDRSIRDAYRAAADAVGPAASFAHPGRALLPETISAGSVTAQPFSYSPPVTVPAGFSAEQQATPVPSAAPAAAPAAVPSPVPQPVAPPETPAAALPPGGGLGAMPSPAAGLSGLSGLGQPFADMLGGLFGSGASGLSSDPFGVDDPFDARDDAADEVLDEADTDPEDEAEEEDAEDEQTEGGETEEEAPEDEVPEEHGPGAVTVEEVPLGAAEAAPVATPVPAALPEPPVDPAPPVAPRPATPCEIAADALPQAGP
ncbi:hypothetical protein O6072_09445 [Mycolicibacterium neoaurum]|uniref:hypothetical protein n=1 Tax=Mycolicibacterium neoaurum TaxID=1795 RepID=UPI00248C4B5F|nr:hypothetical protein [Mycolicibacterium neoaurum]WBP96420.1 hypothetical protein O7W24_09740 [Mycolicibacterium neoaurum]WBS10049.1 hypothetical protein O6072_09445 [Mycolicibacterium neoaurum]